jgi:beta-ureidopropionase / N-carbamoyl-L-amino-acid hydrolase
MSNTRREFLKQTTMLSVAATLPAFGQEQPLRADGDRLRRWIEELSVFGRPPGGTFADGVSRTAYSDADVAGRKYVMGVMRAVGLEPRIDVAGNIFASRAGSDPKLKPLLFGSHIDSVKNGGNFDGELGSLSAIEAIRTLNQTKMATRHPLEVVIWAAEESNYGSGLSGSRAVSGELDPGELERVQDGVKKSDAVRKIGGNPDRYNEAQRQPGWFAAYLELHIEQGGKLEQAGIPVGVVEGIVAIDSYDVTIRGFANHAGTTPMPDRQDALLAAAKLVQAINEVVRSEPGAQVGTVGKLEVLPGAANVIPGEVRHTIDLRDLSSAKLTRIGEGIRKRAAEIAKATRTEIELKQTSRHESAKADPRIQSEIAGSADALGLRHQTMPSGAGHDAQSMAHMGPMGMIFVPSVAGISHSPKELTHWKDCTNGASVLLDAILRLDRA